MENPTTPPENYRKDLAGKLKELRAEKSEYDTPSSTQKFGTLGESKARQFFEKEQESETYEDEKKFKQRDWQMVKDAVLIALPRWKEAGWDADGKAKQELTDLLKSNRVFRNLSHPLTKEEKKILEEKYIQIDEIISNKKKHGMSDKASTGLRSILQSEAELEIFQDSVSGRSQKQQFEKELAKEELIIAARIRNLSVKPGQFFLIGERKPGELYQRPQIGPFDSLEVAQRAAHMQHAEVCDAKGQIVWDSVSSPVMEEVLRNPRFRKDLESSIEKLETEKEEAVGEENYEKAAEIRDTVQDLKNGLDSVVPNKDR